jgi:hypothetical protein
MPISMSAVVVPIPVPSSTFANAYSTFQFSRFSMGVAEADYNRAPEGFEAGEGRRLVRALQDVYRAAVTVQAMRPESELDTLRRENTILFAALMRHESASRINARIAGRVAADDPELI